jgi:hypothetical protein
MTKWFDDWQREKFARLISINRQASGATSTGVPGPRAACAANGAWGFDEMDKLQPSHFHTCPRCGAQTDGYRETAHLCGRAGALVRQVCLQIIPRRKNQGIDRPRDGGERGEDAMNDEVLDGWHRRDEHGISHDRPARCLRCKWCTGFR